LEEPPVGFYLCLCTSRPEALLPTTVSRCQPFYFPPLNRDEIAEGLKAYYDIDSEKAESAADRSDGNMVKALENAKTDEPLRLIAVDEILMNIIMRKNSDLFKINREFQMFKKYGDKKTAIDILLNIDHWLRDIDLMDHGLEPVYNRDLMDRLEKFRKNIAYSNIPEMRELLLKSVDLIDKNVYIDTIYINIVNRFSKYMYRKR
jgi:DNA polymerase III delta prime subunit